MSIKERTRASTGATLEQGITRLVTVTDLMRTLPGNARDLTRNAGALARRQAYATIGAGDAIVATVTRQGAELPSMAKHGAVMLIETTKTRVSAAAIVAGKAQDKVAATTGELTGRTADVAATVRKVTPAATAARVKDAADGRTSQAKDAFAKLAVRGEQVATDLRHDPLMVRIIRDADIRVETAADGLTSAAQKVRARASMQAKRESAATTSTPVRPTAPKNVASHKTTARNTAVAEAAVSTTPTHRAAAYETATRKAAAKKAAATRKANADQVAAKREATAKKAAATRKKTATARDQVAQARHTAAVKAAATRKKNAAPAK